METGTVIRVSIKSLVFCLRRFFPFEEQGGNRTHVIFDCGLSLILGRISSAWYLREDLPRLLSMCPFMI